MLGPNTSPFDILGLEASKELAKRFYDAMDANEPALVAMHPRDESGTRVSPVAREHFTAFLVQWLGGPDDYSQKHGHPRLRMRHMHLEVDEAMRDAWLRCMDVALDHDSIDSEVRDYLIRRFAEVAENLRNR